MMPTKGTKQEKVRAAFEYADIFLEESIKFGERNPDFNLDELDKDEPNESENRTGISRLFGRTK